MLSSDPKRLKSMGIDVRPRWRRRWIVVVTYLVWEAALVAGYKRVDFPSEQVIDWVATACVMYFSIFGIFSPLKSFDEQRTPAGGKVWHGREGKVVLGSLDDWAKYQYGNPFDQITEEEQHELLRTYRVGNYLMPYKGASGFDPQVPDERELAEQNRAIRKTLTFLIWLLIIEAASQNHWKHPSGYMFLELAAVAVTAPKAILLWNEADPRENEEPEIAEQG
jgi:hypothetical protein